MTLVFVSPSGIHSRWFGYCRFPGFTPESLSPAGLSAMLPAWGFVVLVVARTPPSTIGLYKDGTQMSTPYRHQFAANVNG